MEKVLTRPQNAVYPGPIVLLSCGSMEGRRNIITLAWAANIAAEPPMVVVGIRPTRYSHGLVVETGDFVLNIPNEDQLRQADWCGNVSGGTVDKFAQTGFTPVASSRVKSPSIAECPLNIECVVRNRVRAGSHDVFVGEVLAVHVDKTLVTANGDIDFQALRPIVYLKGGYYSVGAKLGAYGYTVKK